jgi:DNA polymerase I
VNGRWGQIVCCDFEFEVAPGGLPNPLCMVAHVLDDNLQHLRTLRLWRGEFGPWPPFDVGPDTLFVAYSAWAEMTCFQVLKWRFPAKIYDLHTAYLSASNILRPYQPDEIRLKEAKNFTAACRAYGLPGWEGLDKKGMQEAIGNGTWRGKYTPEEILCYCEEDVRMSVLLLRAQLRGYSKDWLPPVDVSSILEWSNYSAKTIARIQARGIYIDMWLWNLVQEYREEVIRYLLQKFDPTFGSNHPIYDEDGGFSHKCFEAWLSSVKITSWPRSPRSELLKTDADAFRAMYGAHPGIEALHALKDSIGFIAKARLPIGPDGRNRPSLFPFGTATGRNAHAKSPYNASSGLRSFLIAPPGSEVFYLDWSSQEVGIAAAWSDDKNLKADYQKDVYWGLARMCGATDEEDHKLWKDTNKDHGQRDRMKPLELGLRYGMSIDTLALSLGVHLVEAEHIVNLHRNRYPRFYEWREAVANKAKRDRWIESPDGWRLQLTYSPNTRTLYNFPMQSTGATMLRLAADRLCDAGIVPTMLIHDGILFEETDSRALEHAKGIMLQAGREVCGGFEIKVGVDQHLKNGARYYDKRPVAGELWNAIVDALTEIGAFSPTTADGLLNKNEKVMERRAKRLVLMEKIRVRR